MQSQIYLIQNGKRIKKKKTSITKSDDVSNPIWNEAFTFNLQSNYLHSAAIEVSSQPIIIHLAKLPIKCGFNICRYMWSVRAARQRKLAAADLAHRRVERAANIGTT